MPGVKRCSRCKQDKDESAFQKNGATKDGLQDQCRECRRATDRETYLKRSPEKKERYRERDQEIATRNSRRAYEFLLEHPCVDCGESDPVVLEFDHVSGEKRYNVGDLIRSGRSWEYVRAEIEKCEVRCANCHRRVTATRNGTWKRHIWSQDDRPT